MERVGWRKGPGGMGPGLGLERGPGGMGKKMRKGRENRERARQVYVSACPGDVCPLLCVCKCPGGRVDVRALPCARVCWSGSARWNVRVSYMCT